MVDASILPTRIDRLADDRIAIWWSDGSCRDYTARQLRSACPCATCREQQSAAPPPNVLPVISPAEAAPLRIESMKPVGNYAYHIAFSDGHASGIFTMPLLQRLGTLRAGES